VSSAAERVRDAGFEVDRAQERVEAFALLARAPET
jgi:hypothetical protein